MIYLIGFILLLVIALFLLNEFYVRVVMYHTQWSHINRGKNAGPYDAVAFGSSYCRYGIDFGDYNGFNFGYGGQFFYYTDKMLREYTPKCLKKGGVVYLIIADLVFAEPGKGLYGPENYLKILSKKSLGDEFSFIKYIKDARFPLLFNPLLIKNCIHYVVKGDADEFSHLVTNPLSDEIILKTAKQRCTDWCMQFGLKDTSTPDISSELEEKFAKSREILISMIQFCINNGFKPILVVTPVCKLMQDQLSDDFMQAVLYKNIYMSNVQNVPFYDYLRDSNFANKDLYHKNADFLNSKGRKLFTNRLLKDTLN